MTTPQKKKVLKVMRIRKRVELCMGCDKSRTEHDKYIAKGYKVDTLLCPWHKANPDSIWG